MACLFPFPAQALSLVMHDPPKLHEQCCSSVVRLPSFCLESTLLEEADRDDLLRIPAVDGLSARRAVAFAAVVVFLGRHQSARQTFVAKDVACM